MIVFYVLLMIVAAGLAITGGILMENDEEKA